MELLCNRVSDSAAHSAAYNSDLLKALCLCSSANRTYEVLQAIALIEMVELFCSSANYLENDSYRTALAVEISDSEWYTLAVSICS